MTSIKKTFDARLDFRVSKLHILENQGHHQEDFDTPTSRGVHGSHYFLI